VLEKRKAMEIKELQELNGIGKKRWQPAAQFVSFRLLFERN
jgi:hypothetical protein